MDLRLLSLYLQAEEDEVLATNGVLSWRASSVCSLGKTVLAFALLHSVLQGQIPISKKGNAKECSNYHTIALISHASKVMLKILQPGFSNT